MLLSRVRRRGLRRGGGSFCPLPSDFERPVRGAAEHQGVEAGQIADHYSLGRSLRSYSDLLHTPRAYRREFRARLPLLERAIGCPPAGRQERFPDVVEQENRGLALAPERAYEGGMVTDGENAPPGTQRLVDQSHRSCGEFPWQRPADAVTASTNT